LYYGQRTNVVEDLHSEFPKATESECRRFMRASPRDAPEKLRAYLEWRSKHQLDCSTDDDKSKAAAEDLYTKDVRSWSEAVRMASCSMKTHEIFKDHSSSATATSVSSCESMFEEEEEPQDSVPESNKKKHLFICKGHRGQNLRVGEAPKPTPPTTISKIRQCAYLPFYPDSQRPTRDLDGHRICVHFPGLLDPYNVTNEFYSEVMSLYIESHLDRNNEETVTLLLDVRPGRNWINPSIYNLMSFIRHVAHSLHDLNPQRLHHCILFPIPRAAFYMWKMIQTFLDPNLKELIILIPGNADQSAPIPRAMSKYLDEETISCVEKCRERVLNE